MTKVLQLIVHSCVGLIDLLLDILVLHGPLLQGLLALVPVAVQHGAKGVEPPQLALRHAESVSGPTLWAHLPMPGEDVLLADVAVLKHGAHRGVLRFRQLCSGATRCGLAAGVTAP